MNSVFRPDKYYKNIFEVNFELLYQEGIRLVACDLDNTLVPHYVLDAPLEIATLIKSIRDLGLEIIIISNNNQKRVQRFCKDLDIKYYHSSKKPLKNVFKKVISDFNVTYDKICLIGDQMMTDVFGANRMNIMSIFVEPLAKKDIIYTKLNRRLEKVIIKKLERDNIFKLGEYYE